MKVGFVDAEFFAFHGYYEAERAFGNQYKITLEVDVSDEAFVSEQIDTTLDYTQIYAICAKHMKISYRLIESLAVAILDEIEDSFSSLNRVKIIVKKQMPQLGGKLDYTFIELQRAY